MTEEDLIKVYQSLLDGNDIETVLNNFSLDSLETYGL
uniref:Uncharacterized protein n=1 Tax=Marseillevirus LCMAC201 TaxID=2506605 RepID=A0A481YYB6_9VIRU|nr:MAG: hypothetical protein LCMAC201_03660 [Marseillevirus LCMAC201]